MLTVPLLLWRETPFAANERISQLLLGLFYGLVAALFLYNFFVYLSLRDPVYLAYVAYIAAFGLALFSNDGLAYEFLWPASTWWANHAAATLLSSGLMLGAIFARLFLDTRRLAPPLDCLLLVVAVFSGALAIFAATGWLLNYGEILQSLSFAGAAGALVTLWAAIKVWAQGYRPARFFLLAWSALLMFIVLGALRNFALVPTNFATLYGLHIGLALDVILLSTALADRVRLLGDEKIAARNALLDAAHQHQQVLEQRSDELGIANQELEAFSYTVAHDLRAPLRAISGFSELVRQESGGRLASSALRDLDQIRHSVTRMAR